MIFKLFNIFILLVNLLFIEILLNILFLITDKEEFENYLNTVFFARRVHPKNPKRTFYWGDSLEPNFLPVINCGHYEQTIEKVLRVKF